MTFEGNNLGSIYVAGDTNTKGNPIFSELNPTELELYKKKCKLAFETLVISNRTTNLARTYEVGLTCNLLTQSAWESPNVWSNKNTIMAIFVIDQLDVGENQTIHTETGHWFEINRANTKLEIELIDLDTHLPLDVKLNVKGLFLIK